MKHILLLLFLFNSLFASAQLADNPNPNDVDISLNSVNNPIEILRIGQIAYSQKNYQGFLTAMEKLAELKPLNPGYQYKLAEAYALNDKKTEAFNTLIKLQKQGLFYDIGANDNFENINRFPVFKYIKDNMDISGEHFGEGVEVFNIDKSFSGLLYESISYDGNSQSFLLGSLRDGSVLKVASDGEISQIIAPSDGGENSLWSVNDIAVDENKDVLWVASSSMTQFGKFTKENVGSAGIFKFQLSTGKFLNKYLLPDDKKPHLISSIDLSHSGEVYFIESYKSSILKLNQSSGQFEILFSSPQFSALKSLAVDENASKIYFNDYELGLIGMDTEKKTFFKLGDEESLSTVGISDVIYNDNAIYVIQNGVTPQRVMKLELNPEKNVVTGILPIEASHPKFNFPSYGIVLGDHIYYIANSQMPKTTPWGGLLKDKTWESMHVMRSDKNFHAKENAAFKKHIEKYQKKVEDS
jgi:hypothetical protein